METSIFDALALYQAHLIQVNPKSAKTNFDLTITALSRYTLPAWGYAAPRGRKPTKAEKDALESVLKATSVKKLIHGLKDQESVFEAIKVTDDQKYANRSRLKAFIEWLETSGLLTTKKNKVSNRTPKINRGNGSPPLIRNNPRPTPTAYALKPNELSETTIKEVQEFCDFLTKTRYPGRSFDSLKPTTAENYKRRLYRIFGWFVKSGRAAIEDLSLDLLIPKVKIRGSDFESAQEKATQAAEYLDTWLCDFLAFLEERECNAKGMIGAISPINVLIKFQYKSETQDPSFHKIPAMTVIRRYLKDLDSLAKSQGSAFNKTLKMMSLPDVFTKIIHPLRLECRFKESRGVTRTDAAIASSFQRFLAFGLLTFMPPRRQQEWRDCKIGNYCKLTDKPKSLVPGQFIHPLPDESKKDKRHGYLYKDVDGKWYKDTPAESYKTGKSQGHRKLEIPNTVFADEGKTFYDYLEAFLYGYYRDRKGAWISGGQLSYGKEKIIGEWHNLRFSLQPKVDFLFIQCQKGTKFCDTAFANLIKYAANRLSSKALTPHTLRDIYATWFLDQGYSQAQISSLAYAMGHSEAMLRKTYDERSPEQRTRPIKEEMHTIVGDLVNGDRLPVATKKVTVDQLQHDKETLEKLLAILTPEQKAAMGIR
ncbi:hypothetical protein NIES4075_71870 [Tolypothrix sp. NIES-4075]|uniref:site-specific integrase n=1 Tax=Tolypothrix sp. NIES-4075 TaxID=2005459 RepID=UPI000B5C55C8|nr:site-specific integrase [Tolypothrix sp. NIES-4075]GAX46166.1 hypothetical protein NIES4075_71870 [Tolypothrix sp. NIES-4075]